MKNQMMLVGAALALSGCSWVDETGSQNTTHELLSDAGAVLLTERDVYDRTISDQQSVQANFTLIAEGPGPAGSCGEFLLPTDSAATLLDACDSNLDAADCSLFFTVKSGVSSTYTATVPTLRQSVALTYAIQSEDINGQLNDDEATLCLKAVNDAPEAIDHSYQVEYRGKLETSDADFDFNCNLISGSGVLKGASDDYDFASVSLNTTACLTASIVGEPGQAIGFILNPLGGFTYSSSPALGPGSSDTFKYRVSDGSLESESKTVTITVIGDNDAPVILTIDTLVVDENTSASIAVSSLAEDPEGEALNVSEVSAPSHGSTTQSADSTELTYAPETDYVGEDSFNFTVQDIAGASSQGQVNVLVIKANEAPSIAAPSRLSYDFEDSAPETRRFSVTLADRETELNQLQLSARSSNNSVATIGAPSGISGNGVAEIVINPVANGRTTLTLTVTDRGLTDPTVRPSKSATATVIVDIRGINTNRAPVARNGNLDIRQGSTRTLNLNILTSDPEGDNLTYSLINPPAGTTLSGSNLRIADTATQTLRSFSVVYEVSDGDKTDRGTISITVTAAPNIAPVANNGSSSVQAGETANVNLSNFASDADGDDGDLTFSLVNPPAGASLSGSTLRVATTASGTIRITYRATDEDGGSDTGVITVTVTAAPNIAPVANNGSSSVQAGETANVNLSNFASDADGDDDDLTFSLVNPPAGASLSGSTLRVATTASGTIRITYRATDEDGGSDTGVITVTVTAAPNIAPVANNGSSSVQAGETANVNLSNFASDADGDDGDLTFSLVNPPAGASLSGSTLRVATTASGTIRITYRATDEDGGSDTGVITVTVTAAPNIAPVANNGSSSVQAGETANVNLSNFASDADGDDDDLTFSLVNPPAGASLSGSTLRVATTASGTIRITYRATDEDGGSDTGVITVTVTAAPNIAPVANNGSSSVQAGETANVNLSNFASDADGDDDDLTFSLVNPPAGASLSGSTLRVATTASGTIRITYRATDDDGGSDTGVITVTVTAPPNNAPTTQNVRRDITAGTQTVLDLTEISEDLDGDSLIFSLDDDQIPGVELLNGSVIRVSTDATAATQTISIGFTVSDGIDEAFGTLTVNITATATD